MPAEHEIEHWKERIHTRYLNYLKTSFYFKDAALRASFACALQDIKLIKGPFPEKKSNFGDGVNAHTLAKECFDDFNGILPALRDGPLYRHQEQAIRQVHNQQRNVVVATGTASGKTESFLYPILFALYQQHLDGQLDNSGVRALILYPMNALANDQRGRLGKICEDLEKSGSDFKPTFGQYIGATPKHKRDNWRDAKAHEANRLPGEFIFREDMCRTPPHILLTNYSMLEYLLIRPEESQLFDGDRGRHWQFIVLDEAHQYRGAKGMEMGMLMRRLKQRVHAGGRDDPFRCIATSATIASGEGQQDKKAVAKFAKTLFGESFTDDNVIFGNKEESTDSKPQRFHLFMRALEGAFLSHKAGKDSIILKREADAEADDGSNQAALEIALCRECGQHYYVGREHGGCLIEAIRDPSDGDFGVEFYLPLEDDAGKSHWLCRQCGKLSSGKPDCECDASIPVKECATRPEHPDQLKKCESCNYTRGGIGDPVHEIIHGNDGPNSVIATAMHGLLPKGRRKILSFADSRQEAAFFAWYAEHSYQEVRDRNFIFRALKKENIAAEGLSTIDLSRRLKEVCSENDIFEVSDTSIAKKEKTLNMIFREYLSAEKRISLDGVGLAKWFVKIPNDFKLPKTILEWPWDLTKQEGRELMSLILNQRLRQHRVVALPEGEGSPLPSEVFPWPQQSVRSGVGSAKENIVPWGNTNTSIVKDFLCRLLADRALPKEKLKIGEDMMNDLWDAIHEYYRGFASNQQLLVRAKIDGTFFLNYRWLRIKLPSKDECFECDTCAKLSFLNLRKICPRTNCPGKLVPAVHNKLKQNHYRTLYEDADMPTRLRAEEHTAQIHSQVARKRQEDFSKGGKDGIDLLSSSTTFEVGVDLGDLEAIFLRNVPPEPFNYTQRVGRAGRGGDIPGLALTYCRRNPHDLYHYTNPETHILNRELHPPKLWLQNKKIILRHVVAIALSAFFKEPRNTERFKDVENLVGDWDNPNAVSDLLSFCQDNEILADSIRAVVPADMHEQLGLCNDTWMEAVAGIDSRFADAEREVCADYNRMEELVREAVKDGKHRNPGKFRARARTIADEKPINFLSRKAIIPKYGFPVDVVELDTRPQKRQYATEISLQRDLSQAIAEYAPGSKVVANKKEWESCGIKVVHGKKHTVKHYHYNKARDFKQWAENDKRPNHVIEKGKYIVPQFGFVTKLYENPKDPQGHAGKVYTTRPFFVGFVKEFSEEQSFFSIKITPALPGNMVVLCEGKSGGKFRICRECGTGNAGIKHPHNSPEGWDCHGQIERLALGHEFVTDVVRLQFPGLVDQWTAYSLAYAMLLGVAQRLGVPDTDLNATITAGQTGSETAIVLYDNVPGGAGLVASLQEKKVFHDVLKQAKERVGGACECSESCYACIRSYRNQFAHPELRRKDALRFLETALQEAAN